GGQLDLSARLRTEERLQRRGALRPEVLGNRPGAVFFALAPEDVAKAGLPFALRPGIHAIAERAIAAARRGDRPHLELRIVADLVGEDLEAGVAEDLRHVRHDQWIAQIRLVGAECA